jgi:hypothetical protein
MGIIQNSYGAKDAAGGSPAYGWAKYSVQGPYPPFAVSWQTAPSTGVSYVPSNGLAMNQEIRFLNQNTYTIESLFQITVGASQFRCTKQASVNMSVPGGSSPGQPASCTTVSIVPGAMGNAYGPVAPGAAASNYSWYRFSLTTSDGSLSSPVWSANPSAGATWVATATPLMNQEVRFTTSGTRSLSAAVTASKNGVMSNCAISGPRLTVTVPTGTPAPSPTPMGPARN